MKTTRPKATRQDPPKPIPVANEGEHKDLGSHPSIDGPPNTWPEPWRSLYIERAAIIEFEAKIPRREAVKQAMEQIRYDFLRAVEERNW